jgi:hypothetical protein
MATRIRGSERTARRSLPSSTVVVEAGGGGTVLGVAACGALAVDDDDWNEEVWACIGCLVGRGKTSPCGHFCQPSRPLAIPIA